MRTPFLLILIILLASSCNWFRYKPPVGGQLVEFTGNKLYNQFDTAAYNIEFKRIFSQEASSITYRTLLKRWFAQDRNEPVILTRFLVNRELEQFLGVLQQSADHGMDAEKFRLSELRDLYRQLETDTIKEIESVYPLIARIEILSANAMINYSNALYYGLTNPKRLFRRYQIENQRPDSTQMLKILNGKKLISGLRAVEPSAEAYRALQAKFIVEKDDSIRNRIAINLERLRWRTPEIGAEHVKVNIPDFSLVWLNDKDTLTAMKVCVGGKREANFDEKIATWLKSKDLKDLPSNHETPMMLTKFMSIQVNPAWNIPVSIAKSEIYFNAMKDRFYLANSNIEVYKNGQLIKDPDTIRWARYKREKLPFRFKQGSGAGNALGRLKFNLSNAGGIYLHDTNNKQGFTYANRAISHGCVRVERPLDLAMHLVKKPYTFDRLRMEMDLPPLDTVRNKEFAKLMLRKKDPVKPYRPQNWFSPPKPVQLLITYQTAWVSNGKLELRKDVYGYDEVLGRALGLF